MPIVPPTSVDLVYEVETNMPGPEAAGSQIGAASDGRVMFSGGFLAEGDSIIGVLDSTGALVRAFGRRGEGPNELPGDPEGMWVVGDSLLLFYFGGVRGVRKYGLDGGHGTDVDVPPGSFILLQPATLTSFLAFDIRSQDMTRLELITLDLGEGSTQRVVRAGNEDIGDVLGQGMGWANWTAWAIANDGGVFLGDGLRNRIVRFKRGRASATFGSDAGYRHPSEAELASLIEGQQRRAPGRRKSRTTLAADTVPYFGPHGLQIDDRENLWVVGQDDDGGFATVYANDRQVARFRLAGCRPHRGQVSIAGDWLAVLCTVYDEQDLRETKLRLYKVRF